MQMEFKYYQTIIEDLFYNNIKYSLHCNNIKRPLRFKVTVSLINTGVGPEVNVMQKPSGCSFHAVKK